MFASRVIAGIAYPYGNSVTVPFSRQFFVGGSNSIRAFRARALGPEVLTREEIILMVNFSSINPEILNWK
jgi:outer membrane protein assembly factor BamA